MGSPELFTANPRAKILREQNLKKDSIARQAILNYLHYAESDTDDYRTQAPRDEQRIVKSAKTNPEPNFEYLLNLMMEGFRPPAYFLRYIKSKQDEYNAYVKEYFSSKRAS